MKRPKLNLLVLIVCSFFFHGCFKNDLRDLYQRWVNRATLNEIGVNVPSISNEKKDLFYIASTAKGATFSINLNNNRKYILKPKLEVAKYNYVGDRVHYSLQRVTLTKKELEQISYSHQEGSTIINISINEDFIVSNEGAVLACTIKMGDYGELKDSQGATTETGFPIELGSQIAQAEGEDNTVTNAYRDFDDITFTFTINTPPRA